MVRSEVPSEWAICLFSLPRTISEGLQEAHRRIVVNDGITRSLQHPRNRAAKRFVIVHDMNYGPAYHSRLSSWSWPAGRVLNFSGSAHFRDGAWLGGTRRAGME